MAKVIHACDMEYETPDHVPFVVEVIRIMKEMEYAVDLASGESPVYQNHADLINAWNIRLKSMNPNKLIGKVLTDASKKRIQAPRRKTSGGKKETKEKRKKG